MTPFQAAAPGSHQERRGALERPGILCQAGPGGNMTAALRRVSARVKPPAECRVCMGEHEPDVHEATAAIHRWFREQLALTLAFEYQVGPQSVAGGAIHPSVNRKNRTSKGGYLDQPTAAYGSRGIAATR